jgi:hypothetical protein
MSTREPDVAPRSHGVGFWVAAVVGAGLMAYGAIGLLDAAPATRPGPVALRLLGLDVLHDAVIAPLACAVGWVVVRRFPGWARRPVRAGLFASAVVLLVAWPALRGYGRARVPDNPTVQPLHYGTAVVTVLVVVWLLAGLWLVGSVWWRRRHLAGTSAPEAR